jgi:cytidylate kinase
MERYMSTYRVTIHDHIIYDYVIEANSKQEAEARAEESIMNEESHLWIQDYQAGWTEIGSIYNEADEEI